MKQYKLNINLDDNTTVTTTTALPVPDKTSDLTNDLGFTTNDNIPSNQETIAIIGNQLTNINGRTLSSYTATLSTSPYYKYTITYGNSACTEEQARNYMEYMCGSRYLPMYDYEKPKNTIFMFSDKSLWKPQWDGTTLELYRLSTPLASARYKHNIQIIKSGALVVTFAVISDTSTAFSSYSNVLNALTTNGFSSSAAVTPATGTYYTANNTRIIIGVYYGSSTALGFKYITIASTNSTTMTVAMTPSDGSGTIDISSGFSIYDVVETI